MKKILLMLMIINMLIIPVNAKAPQDIEAPSVILTEQSSGRVLFEKGADIKRPIASVTKIMTALIVMDEIEKGKFGYDDMVTASEKAYSMGGSQIFLDINEEMSVDDMLKGLMVASGNDVAVALGEHVAGTTEAFVEMMNKRAKELGCNDTYFSNTNGLPDDKHYSTAKDVAKISRELLEKHPDIKKYTTIWMDSLRGGEFELANTNKLIYYYDGMTGLKTGFADDAMHCLAGSATRDGLNLITVVLGAPTSEARFSDTRKLLDYGFGSFVYKEGIKKGDVIKTAPVKRGKSDTVDLVAEEDYAVLDDKSSKEEIVKEITTEEEITAPVKKGQALGVMTFKKGDKILGEVNLVADAEIKRKGFFGILADFFGKWMGI